MGAIESTPSQRTKNIQGALDALNDAGPSKRTQELAAAIERLNAAEARRAYQQSLNDVKERRHLLILARELSLTKQRINIDNYRGQSRLVAIDAEIARLNKQSEAQDKLNALIDLQYRASQRVARNEGETIQDYLARRAQEYRSLLQEQAKMEQQNRVDALEKAKATTQFNIDLKELEAQRAELIRKHDLEAHLKHLDDLLKASEEADRAAREAQRKGLQEKLDISKKADDAAADAQKKAIQAQIDRIENQTKREIEDSRKRTEALKEQAKINAENAKAAADKIYEDAKKKAEDAATLAISLASSTETAKLRLAYQGALTVSDLNLVAGGLAGSEFAYGQLRASVEALGLPANLVAGVLANAQILRETYLTQLNKIGRTQVTGDNYGPRGQAKGGVFPLTNSMNFGNNMRVGEEGTELGIVLSNRVTAALRNSQGGGPAIGTLNIYSYENPKDAEYRQRRVIRDEVMRSF
jgi:colicin import membrane protein